MSNEITPWRAPDCAIALRVSDLSDRETSSREINETYGEGGGLNANYRTVEAVAAVASVLAFRNNLQYGVHYVFKTGGGDSISFDFCDKETMLKAKDIFRELNVLA